MRYSRRWRNACLKIERSKRKRSRRILLLNADGQSVLLSATSTTYTATSSHARGDHK